MWWSGLTHRIVVPAFVGSNPIIHPIFFMKKTWKPRLFLGPMFAGKTTKLLHTMHYYRRYFKLTQLYLFRSLFDTRTQSNLLKSHGFKTLNVKVFHKATDLNELITKKTSLPVIFISEMQFLPLPELEELFRIAQKHDIQVFAEGLDLDYRAQPFPFQTSLQVFKPKITLLYARCTDCFAKATHSFRLSTNQTLFLLGGKDLYSALCATCYEKRRF